jgi:type I restriction enzyme, R subunit
MFEERGMENSIRSSKTKPNSGDSKDVKLTPLSLKQNLTLFSAPDDREIATSHLPALEVLMKLGWEYISPGKALQLRGNRTASVLLDEILVPWLRKTQKIKFKGKTIDFSEGNIQNAVQALKDIPYDGLIRTNEKIYDLLTLGKSLQQSIEGDLKSFTLNYIDWKNPENNEYHVSEEFEVERSGSHNKRRPDLILFINGIPIVVIECKRPSLRDPIHEAISQQIRNQKDDEIPLLFIYSQLLLSLAQTEAKYATTGTPLKFWAIWREQSPTFEEDVSRIVLEKLKGDQIVLLMDSEHPKNQLMDFLDDDRLPTEQDRLLIALCKPERLLDLIHNYIIYDAGNKKIARYQQYFCVEKINKRIAKRQDNGQRLGGVVWHTQGSGKSLTMVMLAKAIALAEDFDEYKIILVTDRIDLDDQIYKTFQQCGSELKQAKTGKHLSELLQGSRQRIITTIIDKFEAAVGPRMTPNTSPNIFVLVDEGHRSQYGPRHAKMRRGLPNACYIGFTGTPLMKKDKNTMDKFGGLIDIYTIDQAVKDKAVVPLFYEGRHADQHVDSKAIDDWFTRITDNLSREQATDLKKKYARKEQIYKTVQMTYEVAWDISEHYNNHWRGLLKGQLVTQSKASALMYKEALDDIGKVNSEVLISGPDDREGEEDIYSENTKTEIRFWKEVLKKYGNEKEYNKQLINAFKHSEEPEIIIVVDKLLTGFDAPRNGILYLARPLKDHRLLQAIARVNRLHEGKEFGLIVDYRGVLKNLSSALDLYKDLPEFDEDDLKNIITDVAVEVNKLKERHTILLDTFKQVQNHNDSEEYEELLGDEGLRLKFYDRLSKYARTLDLALSSSHFYEDSTIDEINRYKGDLKRFGNLRISVRRRYSEVIDFGEYEAKIQKLLDTHVGTDKVEPITDLVNIFDTEAFAKEIEELSNPAAKADTIAHRTAKTISERMQEDQAFYRRFSDMLNDAIRDFREGRIEALEHLKKVTVIHNHVLNRTGDQIPDSLVDHEVAKAYFGTIREVLAVEVDVPDIDKILAEAALMVESLVEKYRVVNWINDVDTQNRMRTAIEDLMFEIKDTNGWNITFESIDKIMEECIGVAKVRRP